MYALTTSSLVFALIFGGALLGMVIRRFLPDDHFAPESKDTIRLAIGLVVTMTGLVLGMLVSSAKSFFDSEKNQVAELSSQIIILNNLLTAYGPEAGKLRVEARQSVEEVVDRIWPTTKTQSSQLKPSAKGSYFYQQLELLAPKTDAQTSDKAQLLAATMNLTKTYSLLYLQSEQTSIAPTLLGVVTSWLVAIFISFGVFAPRNSTVMVTLVVCALAVSAAIYIIMEMYSPFSGAIKISPAAVHDALSQMATGQ
jgi:putative lipoic acid-binding regulatory protein